jgi:hypothetical protein
MARFRIGANHMNSFLLASGADPYAHLRGHMANVAAAPFQGAWATVEVQPDPFSRQRYSIGVVVAGQGSFVFRLLDDFAKFECLYDRDDVSVLRSLVDSAEQTLLRGQKASAEVGTVQFDSDAVMLGELWPTAGTSADAILSRLFFDVVPFLPRDERRLREFITLDNAAVRRLVDDKLKEIAGIAFERIVTEPQRAVMDRVSGEAHWLDFNLAPGGQAGSVISAVYKTPDRIELNFLRASRDLSTYARIMTIEKQLGLFVMTPAKDSMPQADLDRIENVLGEQSWSLEQQGFVVSAHDSVAPLAQDVMEWAGVL